MNKKPTCSIEAYDGCELVPYKEYVECILHSSKEDILNDHYLQFSDLLGDFRKSFIEHTVVSIFKHKEETKKVNKVTVRAFLTGAKNSDFSEEVKLYLSEQKVIYSHISFPTRDDRDLHLDYLDVLQSLGIIHFNYCKFYVDHLELGRTECYFQDCEFYDHWQLEDYVPMGNKDYGVYQSCIFYKDVSASGRELESERFILNYNQFSNCSFNGELVFEYVDIKKQLFKNSDRLKLKIGFLKIHHCEIEERFILNNHCIESVYIKSSCFNGKFEFKENCIKSLELDDSNFKKLAEFYKSKIQTFSMYKSIFDNYVGFERVLFGSRESINDAGYIASFTYVTFLNIVNMRHAEFLSGIDIEHTNFTSDTNFKNVKIEQGNTSRESYRIIKYSFDKIGNYIDANQYYALEMQEYKKELAAEKGHFQEKLVFWFNARVSNFGQSYLRPFLIFLGLAISYYLIYLGRVDGLMDQYLPVLNENMLDSTEHLNNFAKKILPFQKFLTEGMEFTSLFFYIFYILLIWQMITTVKRHTKR